TLPKDGVMSACDPMYGPAVRCKKTSQVGGSAVLHQCIRPLIGAFCAPGHHGYQRACDLISGEASTGHLDHQCSHAPVEAFRSGLRQIGLVENRDIVLDIVWTESGDPSQAVTEVIQRGAERQHQAARHLWRARRDDVPANRAEAAYQEKCRSIE